MSILLLQSSSRLYILSSAEAGPAELLFFQRGVTFWREKGVIFTIRYAVQQSEVNHMATVW